MLIRYLKQYINVCFIFCKMDNKNRKDKKRLLIIVMIIAFLVLIVSLASLYTQRVVSCGTAQSCTIPLPFLIPIIASVSLFVGSLISYFMIEKLLKKDTSFKKSSEFIKKLFDNDEYKILKLISKSDEISQAKIVHEVGLPRLKVFRIIEKLKYKGIIDKEEKGKLRLIKMNNDLKELFD